MKQGLEDKFSKMSIYKSEGGKLYGPKNVDICKYWLQNRCSKPNHMQCRWHHLCTTCGVVNQHIYSDCTQQGEEITG